MRVILCVIIIFGLHTVYAKKSNELVFKFEDKIDSMAILADTIRYSTSTIGKLNANNSFRELLRNVLTDSLSIFYDFKKVSNLSVVTSPDNQFRIYTWTLKMGNSEYDYYGFTQYQRKRKKSVFSPVKIENFVYELNNKSSSIGDDELAKLDSSNWLGCVYYNIVAPPKKNDDTYLLLGWDGFGYRSTKKIIETVKFSNKGVVTFGDKIIRYDLTHGTKAAPKFQTKSRIIFEYSGNVSMTCNYNSSLEMVIFDHLAPSNPALANLKFTYAPDFTYDGLAYEKKKWIYKKDVDVRNREDIKPVKWKPRNTKDRTEDTLIPMRE